MYLPLKFFKTSKFVDSYAIIRKKLYAVKLYFPLFNFFPDNELSKSFDVLKTFYICIFKILLPIYSNYRVSFMR